MIPGTVFHGLLQTLTRAGNCFFGNVAVIEICEHNLVWTIVRIVFQQGQQQAQFAVGELLLDVHTWSFAITGMQVRKRAEASIKREGVTFWQSVLQVKVTDLLSIKMIAYGRISTTRQTRHIPPLPGIPGPGAGGPLLAVWSRK